MCDVCRSKGLNTKFLNGKRYRETTVKLFGIKYGRSVKFVLCYLHEVDLFKMGEVVFLKRYPSLILSQNMEGDVDDLDFDLSA